MNNQVNIFFSIIPLPLLLICRYCIRFLRFRCSLFRSIWSIPLTKIGKPDLWCSVRWVWNITDWLAQLPVCNVLWLHQFFQMLFSPLRLFAVFPQRFVSSFPNSQPMQYHLICYLENHKIGTYFYISFFFIQNYTFTVKI